MPATKAEWFDQPGAAEPGLRFACTLCGNCCSGPPGYVLFTRDEGAAIARRLGVSPDAFVKGYTQETPEGRSLREVPTQENGGAQPGLDCVFLDRKTIPGRAICGVYEDRPEQCRTWPFWPSVVKSPATWARAKKTCPGIDQGPRFTPGHIRVTRDRCEI